MKRVGASYTLKLHDELGRGNFGTVFKTNLEGLPGDYATKFIPKSNFSNSDKFFDEAAKLINAKHANVVNFVWASESECPDNPVTGQLSHVLIVMEFYPDGSVDRHIPPNGLAIGDAKFIISECLKGLAYSHSKGIIHLDIKPGNLLRRPDRGVVVSDFGQALCMNPSTGVSAPGPQHQMYAVHRPPETVFSPASDLWQVGLTLYRLISGLAGSELPPFLAHGKQQLRDTLQMPSHCPTNLWKIIRKLLAHKPEERFGDCIDTLSALSKINQLLDWRQTVLTNDEAGWEAPSTEEKLRATSSQKGWLVEYTKKGRRVAKICPPEPALPPQKALEKVRACFLRLENLAK